MAGSFPAGGTAGGGTGSGVGPPNVELRPRQHPSRWPPDQQRVTRDPGPRLAWLCPPPASSSAYDNGADGSGDHSPQPRREWPVSAEPPAPRGTCPPLTVLG